MEITTRLLLLSRQLLPRAGLLFDIPNRYPFTDQVGQHDGPPQLLQYIQGPVDLLSASIVGTETVSSKQGTATVTVSAGKLSVGSGTLWSFVLSNGSQYEYGLISDVVTGAVPDVSGNDHPLAFVVADTSLVCKSGREFGSNYASLFGYTVGDETQFIDQHWLRVVKVGQIIPALLDKSGCPTWSGNDPIPPTAYFNGVFTPAQISAEGGTYTGGPTVFADNLGVLQTAPSGVPALQGMRLTGGTYYDTAIDGTPLLPSVSQPTRTFDAGFTTSAPAPTYKKYTRNNPAVDLPGYLCEPARTNYALNSAVPATHTTGTVSVGTYTLWQDGTGSITATAGTAVGTFGTASNGVPAAITITTAGTVVLAASGTNTWVQLESGPFKTSQILTTTAAAVRQGTVLSFPAVGKIRSNNLAFRLTVVPRASGQATRLFNTQIGPDFLAIMITPTYFSIRKYKSSSVEAPAFLTHTAGVPYEIIAVSSAYHGLVCSVRAFSGSWGSFINSAVNSTAEAKANAVTGSIYQLGAVIGGFQFTGNISELDTLLIPDGIADPLAWAKQQWGLPA